MQKIINEIQILKTYSGITFWSEDGKRIFHSILKLHLDNFVWIQTILFFEKQEVNGALKTTILSVK